MARQTPSLHDEHDEVEVEIRDVSVEYHRRGAGPVLAVDRFTAEVRKNEKCVLLGPSGCGKSTLLAAMGGFYPIKSGRLAVGGVPVNGPSMRTIMVFQEFDQLLPWKTVEDNISFALHRRWPSMSRTERRERAEHFVQLVGLERQAGQFPFTLSGGQKQRAAIARSFAVEPELLLMDEPFGALDAINRERMQDELNQIWEKAMTTIVFVTHDVHEAIRLGHRIMVMTEGPGRLRSCVTNSCLGVDLSSPEVSELAADIRSMLEQKVASDESEATEVTGKQSQTRLVQ